MSNEAVGSVRMSGSDQTTIDHIKAILHNDRFIPDPLFPERLPVPFHSKGFVYVEEGKKLSIRTDEEQATYIEAVCTGLFNQIDESPSHEIRLDRSFAGLLECRFKLNDSDSPFRHLRSPEIECRITERIIHFLSRLPETPLELPGLPSGLPLAYFTSRTVLKDPHGPRWEDLKVALHLSINVIRVAMCIVIYPWIATGKLSEFINDIAMLLDTATRKSAAAKVRMARHRWYLVRAFLWASWQRIVAMYFSLLMSHHLDAGIDDGMASSKYHLQGFSPTPGMSIQEISRRYARQAKSHYMCGWAFELLRNNPVCIGMDFRRFHKHFSNAFDRFPGRCTPNETISCEGNHPHSCHRFVGMTIRDQSAHDGGCTGCEKLTWDESSYRSTPGARAVSLQDTLGNKLRYRTASNKTLAVSHVWSHGQGGRPETGMNHCLHARYKSIAKSMGCDSYWMDTPCIPTDHILRREAISYINAVFTESKATLICDRDLMEIEFEENISVELRELILITTIICDWNVRAWTFLEAFRGRESIYLLCKGNKTISLKETVEIVHHEGSLDVAILLLTVPHLQPRVHRQDEPDPTWIGKYPQILESRKMFLPLHKGFLTVENSAMLLSHRSASRPGDDVVIWSLLLDEEVYENALDFWRSRQGRYIHTSFLVSTAPRVNIWRFGWAPLSPRLFHDHSAKTEPHSMGSNDMTSELGLITDEGLKANWLFCNLGRVERIVSKLPLSGRVLLGSANLKAVSKAFLQHYRWGALLRPVWAHLPSEPTPAPNREDMSRILVVVCGTNDLPNDDTAWEWKGVHDWDMKERLPSFTYKKKLLLV